MQKRQTKSRVDVTKPVAQGRAQGRSLPKDLPPTGIRASAIKGGATTVKGSKSNSDN